MKIVGVVAVVSATGGSALVLSHRAEPQVAVVEAPAPRPAAHTPKPVPLATSEAPAAIPSAVLEAPSSEPTATPTPHRKPAPKTEEAPNPPTPQEEIELLQRAQDALTSRPLETLALCKRHEQRFSNGLLVQEREVVAVEALVKLGRRDEARARADRFKNSFPTSTHTRRLDALLAD